VGSDFNDEDNDGYPAISGKEAMGGEGYCAPALNHNCTYVRAPLSFLPPYQTTDKVMVVSRYRFDINTTNPGTDMTGMGTSTVTLFDNHAVDCHVTGGGECNSDQVEFVDQNRPIYKMPDGSLYSSSSPKNNSTVASYLFAASEMATCAMVRSKLP
jgi:hypothetical protein